MDHDEIREKLHVNKDEILEIESNLDDIRIRLDETNGLRNREKEVSEFLTSNKDQLKQLRKDIANLDLQDRKILVEAMLDGPIEVDYQDDDPNEGPGGAVPNYKLKYNTEILQRFMNEGKIKLDKNSRESFC